MADTYQYEFVNGCDGSPLTGPETGLCWTDTTGIDMTDEEAKEHACELSLRLGGYLVAARRVHETFCVQHFEGSFADRMGEPIPHEQLPDLYRKD